MDIISLGRDKSNRMTCKFPNPIQIDSLQTTFHLILKLIFFEIILKKQKKETMSLSPCCLTGSHNTAESENIAFSFLTLETAEVS